MKKEVKKNQKGRQLVEQSEQQLFFSTEYCPECSTAIALSDPKKVLVARGTAHLDCVIAKAAKMLIAAGLPKPANCNDLIALGGYLKQQMAQLLDQPATDPAVAKKTAAIYEAAGYLLIPSVDVSAVAKKTRLTAFALD